MTRSLVTGAGGFIGSQLVRALLQEGGEVHVQVRAGANLWRLEEVQESLHIHECDMRDAHAVASLIARVAPTHVFHLAQYGGNAGETDVQTIRDTIITGTANLYSACASVSGLQAIIHGGSSSEYGTKTEPMREDMLAEPNTEYALAKLWATLYGEHMRREKDMPISTLRLFSVYGPYEARKRLFPAVILSLLRSVRPTLAKPETARDFVYVEDVVEAFLLAREKPFGIYNIGTGVSTTIKEVVDTITTVIPSSTPLLWEGYNGRTFDTSFWCADMSRTRDVLGWLPKTTVSEGTHKTITWFTQHEQAYD